MPINNIAVMRRPLRW